MLSYLFMVLFFYLSFVQILKGYGFIHRKVGYQSFYDSVNLDQTVLMHYFILGFSLFGDLFILR